MDVQARWAPTRHPQRRSSWISALSKRLPSLWTRRRKRSAQSAPPILMPRVRGPLPLLRHCCGTWRMTRACLMRSQCKRRPSLSFQRFLHLQLPIRLRFAEWCVRSTASVARQLTLASGRSAAPAARLGKARVCCVAAAARTSGDSGRCAQIASSPTLSEASCYYFA